MENRNLHGPTEKKKRVGIAAIEQMNSVRMQGKRVYTMHTKILHCRAHTHAKWQCAPSRIECRVAEVCLELISLLLLSEIVYFILCARAVDAHRKIQYIVVVVVGLALAAPYHSNKDRSLHDIFRFLHARTDTMN